MAQWTYQVAGERGVEELAARVLHGDRSSADADWDAVDGGKMPVRWWFEIRFSKMYHFLKDA